MGTGGTPETSCSQPPFFLVFGAQEPPELAPLSQADQKQHGNTRRSVSAVFSLWVKRRWLPVRAAPTAPPQQPWMEATTVIQGPLEPRERSHNGTARCPDWVGAEWPQETSW